MFGSKKANIIISIIAAIAIWAYVTNVINPVANQAIRGIPVELQGIEELNADGFTVESNTYTVDIRVQGPRSELDKLNSDSFFATANVKGFAPGVNQVSVNVTGPSQVKILTDKINIEIRVVELVSVAKPIRLEYNGAFPGDMEPGFVSLSPHEIDVSGAKDIVKKVAYISAKIDSTRLKEEETTFSVDAVPMSSAGNQVFDVGLSQDSIEVTATLCHVKEVPLDISIVGTPAPGKTVTRLDIPRNIVLRGSAEALGKIEGIKASPIDIEKIKETTVYIPDLNLPAGVELAEASRDLTITVEIGGIEVKTIEITGEQIEIEGLADGYTAHINTGTILLNIFGTPEQIKNFKIKEVKVYVDMKDADYTGDFVDLPVKFIFENKIARIEASPAEVRVLLAKIPDTTPAEPIVTSDGAADPAQDNAAAGVFILNFGTLWRIYG